MKRKTYFLSLLGILLIALGYFLVRRYEASQSVSVSVFAMDTYMRIDIYGKKAKQAGDETVKRITALEKLLSVNDKESEIYRLNSGEGTEVSAEVSNLLNKAIEYSGITSGKFDITMYPVTRAWGFTEEETKVPTEEDISNALKKVGYEKPVISGTQVILNNTEIDLGAIAKGYTSDCIVEVLDKYNIDSALINLGGNVYAYHKKTDGSLYKVGIEDPASEAGGIIGYVEVSDKAVVTSGKNKRFFEADGKKYWHIFDPKTGCPADSGIASVTVITDMAAYADALSTAIFVGGEAFAKELLSDRKDFQYIIVTDDGEIHTSENGTLLGR